MFVLAAWDDVGSLPPYVESGCGVFLLELEERMPERCHLERFSFCVGSGIGEVHSATILG